MFRCWPARCRSSPSAASRHPGRRRPRSGAPGTVTARPPWPGCGSRSPRRGPRPAPTSVPVRPAPAATRQGRPRQDSRLPPARLDPLADRHPPIVPAAFRKLDALAVLTGPLLPAPQDLPRPPRPDPAGLPRRPGRPARRARPGPQRRLLRNTRYLDAIVEHLRGSGQPVRDEDVARLSPLAHAHLNCLGRYAFTTQPAAELRPLLTTAGTRACLGQEPAFSLYQLPSGPASPRPGRTPAMSAFPASDPRSTAPKPTVVLVHGAFADSSGFGAVIDRLRSDGYTVRAAPNPLLGLQFDAATVGVPRQHQGPQDPRRSLLRRRCDHAGRLRRPRRQCARVPRRARPDRGEVVGDLANTPVAHPVAPLPLVSVNVTQPDGTKQADLYLDPSQFRARFAADLPRTSPLTSPRPSDPPAPRTSRARSPSSPAWKTIPTGTSCPGRTTRSRPTSSGSRQTACTRTRSRSTARTPSTSATPRQSPISSSRPRKRPAEQRHRLLAPTRAAGAASSSQHSPERPAREPSRCDAARAHAQTPANQR